MRLEVSSPPAQMPHLGDFMPSPPSHGRCGSLGHVSMLDPQAAAHLHHEDRTSVLHSTRAISPPQLGFAAVEGRNKRKAVAEWIQELCGISVPFDTNQAFTAALANGVVLCHVLAAVRPGSLPQVRAN